MGKQDFVRFGVKVRFGRIFHIAPDVVDNKVCNKIFSYLNGHNIWPKYDSLRHITENIEAVHCLYVLGDWMEAHN